MGDDVYALRGADYAWAWPAPSTLKAAGIRFVCRYVSWDLTKLPPPMPGPPARGGTTAGRSRLAFTEGTTTPRATTRNEVAALLSAGIAVVLVWEYGAQDMRLGYSRGAGDATEAARQATALGLPGAEIYFACDYDATEEDQTRINAYLDGARASIGNGRVSMYGGYWPLARARAAGKILHSWGTYAWSGTNWASCGWTPHLMQQLGYISIGGTQCDIDVAAVADFGQTPRPGPAPKPVPPGPAPAFPYPASGYLGVASSDPDCHSGYYPADAAHVRAWQQQLAARGWAITVDGDYGAGSASVCRAFQQEKGLAVDGKVGPVTWRAAWAAPVTETG